MQIRRIKSVSGYKSFADFKWEKFCKDKGGNESIFQNFTVIFGENGSGKSSICDILKSISQTQDFTNSHPTLVEIEIKNDSGSQDYKYENGEWTPVQLDKKTFLFFDLDFVNANVHTHGVRSNNLQQGAHTQKAGKLIIDLDEQANNLKDAIEEKRKEIEFFQKSKSGLLGKIFSSKDREFYNIYSSTDEAGKNLKIAEVKNELKELEVGLATLHKLDKQYSEIGQIPTLNEILTPDLISSAETYIELSTRQIKEKAQGEADDKIKSHFQQHRTFIETAKDRIPQDYSKTDCPLCMQPLSNAIKVIEYYRAAFDQTYEIEKRKLLADVEDRKNELNKFKLSLGLLPTKVTDIFDSLERTKTTFEIPNIYSLDEKGAYVAKANNFPIPALEELLGVLESLKRIDHEQIDVTKVYETASKEIASVKDFLVSSFQNLAQRIPYPYANIISAPLLG